MSITTKILDGKGSGKEAKVTTRGELVTAPLEHSVAYPQTFDVINTAYNFVGPLANKRFVITAITLTANKNVSNTVEATVTIYEATASDSTTVSTLIYQDGLIRQTRAVITGLNLITSEGVWINGKTDDDDIIANVMGYYVDA